MDLQNKVALVTGASSGIGQAIAIDLAKKGVRILINYRKNREGAEKTLAEVKQYSDGIIYQADVSIESETKRMFEEIKTIYPKIDILVNNAGDAQPGEVGDITMWNYQLKNILLSCVITSSAFLDNLSEGQKAKIINISSVYGMLDSGNEEFIQYSTSKAAMNSFTRMLAKKVAPNVLVNAVAPGYTWSPKWEGITNGKNNSIIQTTQIKRFIEPEEVAEVVTLLAQNDALTGEIIKVDGGVSLFHIE